MTRLVSLKHVSFLRFAIDGWWSATSTADLHSIFNLFFVERLNGAYLIHGD
jgi:hypothetical protein